MSTTFDAPTGEACLARRDVSNSPLQALTLLNDQMFLEAAQAMAKQVTAGPADDDSRLQNIFSLFGQIPDVLEDAWIKLALGDKEEAKRIIDALPEEHPFEIRYAKIENVNWESCTTVLSEQEKRRVLGQGW